MQHLKNILNNSYLENSFQINIYNRFVISLTTRRVLMMWKGEKNSLIAKNSTKVKIKELGQFRQLQDKAENYGNKSTVTENYTKKYLQFKLSTNKRRPRKSKIRFDKIIMDMRT